MLNYRLQDGCHNCAHVFELYDYGQDERYFCALDAPPRPLCGSLKMGEGPNSQLAKERGYSETAWREWSYVRGVEQGGTCDVWQAVQSA